MLYHLRPRCYSPRANVFLLDAVFPTFGLTLRVNRELATGRPYPNRWYSVGYRKNARRKAFEGILIEADPVEEFTARFRWVFSPLEVGFHTVKYRLADQNFDAASDCVMFWHADGQVDLDQIPKDMETPMFKYIPGEHEEMFVSETLTMPTVDPRYFEEFGGDRFPSFDTAFRAGEVFPSE